MDHEFKFMLVCSLVICVNVIYFSILEDRKKSHELHCGQRPKRLDHLEDLQNVAGENDSVSVGVWPWQVSILSQPNPSVPFSQICGGAIIHESWIMTAAACVTEKQSNLMIRAGSPSLHVDDEFTQQSEVTTMIRHRKFNPVTLQYNIVLLKLKTPFVLNEFVYPVCVPDKAANEHKHEECHITGYNVQPGDDFGLLHESIVFGLARSTCNKPDKWNYFVPADMVCAGSFAKVGRACEKNLGGPLTCYSRHDHRYFIIGIRVKAASCGDLYRPDIYLDVSRHYWWIHNQLWKCSI